MPKAPAQEGIPLNEEATHHQLAQYLVAQRGLDTGAPPVGAEGQLWSPNERGLWVPTSLDRLAVDVGRRFHSFKRCAKANDYRGIAAHLLAMQDDPEFFAKAPVGVVCPSGFWTLHDGRLVRVDLAIEHRQRFALEVDPDFDSEAVLFWQYLAAALDGEARDEQMDLAAEAVGAGLFGLAAKLMTVVLLLGPGASGKSTFLSIVQQLFPALFVAAVSPTRWDHEYYAAGLAGKRLNVVGELPEDRPLPAAAFKNVTGGDLLEGRHPTHRPFYFRSEAAHFFNANTLPATTDRSDAFFRRWRVLRFANAVPPEQRDPDLAQKIIERELGGVLAWAMQGAERAARRGRLATTRVHEQVMQRWRIGSNPVLLFVTDPEYCELSPEHEERAADVYAAYRRWAQVHGNRPMSSQSFWQTLDDTAAGFGIYRGRSADQRWARGLRLKAPDGGLLP